MAVLREIFRGAFKAAARRQQLLTANMMGNAFPLFVVYSWFSLNEVTPEKSLQSAGPLAGVAFFLTWLMATTLASFQTESRETPFIPALKRIPQYLPWTLALAGTLALFHWMSIVLSFAVWVVGVAILLALLPLVSQAAGGGFSRRKAIDLIFNEYYWLSATVLLVAGFYLPVLVLSWLKPGDNLVVSAMIGGLRLGLFYFLTIGAWVILAAIIGLMGTNSIPGIEDARASDISSGTDRTAGRGDGPPEEKRQSSSDRYVEFSLQQERGDHREQQEPDEPVSLNSEERHTG